MIKIVIADDHQLLREGVKKIVRPIPDIEVVGEGSTLDQAIALVENHCPDLLILDLGLPEYEGVEGLVKIRRTFPALPVLVLSMYSEERFAVRALKSGASGYITKAMAAEELIKAIRKIMTGSAFLTDRLAELLAINAQSEGTNLRSKLTARELKVLSLLGHGNSTQQIAEILGLSLSTVYTYRSRLFRKTGLFSIAALIRYAIEERLIDFGA